MRRYEQGRHHFRGQPVSLPLTVAVLTPISLWLKLRHMKTKQKEYFSIVIWRWCFGRREVTQDTKAGKQVKEIFVSHTHTNISVTFAGKDSFARIIAARRRLLRYIRVFTFRLFTRHLLWYDGFQKGLWNISTRFNSQQMYKEKFARWVYTSQCRRTNRIPWNQERTLATKEILCYHLNIANHSHVNFGTNEIHITFNALF